MNDKESDMDKYVVDCCNAGCGWSGLSTDCVCFKHHPDDLMCPECNEVVEPVGEACGDGLEDVG
jgi:hypothetical protein